MDDIPVSCQQKIMGLSKQGCYSDACLAHLVSRLQDRVDDSSSHSTNTGLTADKSGVKCDQMLSEDQQMDHLCQKQQASVISEHINSSNVKMDSSVGDRVEDVLSCEDMCPCGTQHTCRTISKEHDIDHSKRPSSESAAFVSKKIKVEMDENIPPQDGDKKPRKAMSSTKCIFKPSDFYRSYMKLVEGLRDR